MIGKILNINIELGFGFIRSENSEDYYFKTRNCNFNAISGDEVAFEINKKKDRPFAYAIRKVYTNKKGLKFTTRIKQSHVHLDLDKFLPLVIDSIEDASIGDYIKLEHEFPEIIGKSDCVPTNENDEILFAKRKDRFGHTRFILNSKPVDSKHLFLAFKKVEHYFLIMTIYIGRQAPREPWDKLATENDLTFWNNHALIYKPEDIIQGSETTVSPWK